MFLTADTRRTTPVDDLHPSSYRRAPGGTAPTSRRASSSLGGGVTPGALSQFPGLHSISSSCGKRHARGGVLQPCQFRRASPRQRADASGRWPKLSSADADAYDVITADAISASCGREQRNSVEYFRLVRNALRTDGVRPALETVPRPGPSTRDAQSLCRGIPEATLWG